MQCFINKTKMFTHSGPSGRNYVPSNTLSMPVKWTAQMTDALCRPLCLKRNVIVNVKIMGFTVDFSDWFCALWDPHMNSVPVCTTLIVTHSNLQYGTVKIPPKNRFCFIHSLIYIYKGASKWMKKNILAKTFNPCRGTSWPQKIFTAI